MTSASQENEYKEAMWIEVHRFTNVFLVIYLSLVKIRKNRDFCENLQKIARKSTDNYKLL
jgi:hypothetical protein